MIAVATGSGQNAAMPKRQSKAIAPTTTMALDMPVPNSWGTTCMNSRSWSAQSFMMVFVRSDRSRLPKNDSGSILTVLGDAFAFAGAFLVDGAVCALVFE